VNGVYWIYGPDPAQADSSPSAAPLKPWPLGVVLCPSGGKYLARELAHMKRSGVWTLVSLLSEDQVEMLDLREEPRIARELGMYFLHHPLPDHQVPPDVGRFRVFVEHLAERFRNGDRIGMHCWGSIGRAPMTAACTLIHLGWEPRLALAAVEAARGCAVPDTEEQLRWVLSYKARA